MPNRQKLESVILLKENGKGRINKSQQGTEFCVKENQGQ
jgi:hypothetical protein